MKNLNISLVLLVLVTSMFYQNLSDTSNNGSLNHVNQVLEDEDQPDTQSSGTILYLPILKTVSSASVYGVELPNLLPPPEQGMVYVNNAKMYHLRKNGLLWSDVEPTVGARNWYSGSAYNMENELKYAAEQGKKAILIVRRTPDWARTDPALSCGRIKDDKIDEFANFLFDAVKRYSAAPYHLEYIEIWNEPDADPKDMLNTEDPFGCWGDKSDPYFGGKYYASVLKQVYPKIKAANPNIQVVLGGLLMECEPSKCVKGKYFEGILAGGGGPYFDIISFHSYDYYYGSTGVYQNLNWTSAWNTTGPTITNKITEIRNTLNKYNIGQKPIFCTELALLCVNCNPDNIFETTKAYYVAQAYAVSIVQGLDSSVWYYLLDGWRNSGLLTSEYVPHPAYNAYLFSRQELGTSRSGRNVSQGQVFGYEINTRKGRVWVVWSKDGNNQTLVLPNTPFAGYDVYGNLIPVSQTMTVSIAPVYIELDAP